MKKQELFDAIKTSVKFLDENYRIIGGDHHVVNIPSDKFDNISIIGHFGKRRIEGVYVAVEDEMHVYQYDVTNEISESSKRYKESYFTDTDLATQLMYNTILSAASNIELLLNIPYDQLMLGEGNFPLTNAADFAF